MEPYAIKIVSKNKKRKAHKNGEEGGDVEMVSRFVRYKWKLQSASYLNMYCYCIGMGSLLFGRCTYLFLSKALDTSSSGFLLL